MKPSKEKNGDLWFVYMVRCRDKTFYTGIAKDVTKRFKAHKTGKGAKYTRSRCPLKLVYHEPVGTISDAIKREIQLKKLPRAKKLALTKVFKAK